MPGIGGFGPRPNEGTSGLWWRASDEVPVRPARTWLARKGWRRYGLISGDEEPKVA